MDVNGTRFHLALGRDDWSRWTNARGQLLAEVWAGDGDVDSPAFAAGSASVTLAPRLPRFHAPAGLTLPSIAERRGGARDRYGNWFWIARGGREVRVWSAGSRTSAHLWSVGEAGTPPPSPASGSFQPQAPAPPPPAELRGVAITDDHYLVLGMVDPAGLLIFDLHSGRPPVQLVWPTSIPFSPFDLAARPGGGVWILDRVHRRYWGLDRHFGVIPQGAVQSARGGDFRPTDGSSQAGPTERAFPAGISLEASSPLSAADPIAIEALPDGCSVLVLDFAPGQPFSLIQRSTVDGPAGVPVSTAEFARFVDVQEQSDLDLSALDFALVPSSAPLGRLLVLSTDGAQAFPFDLALHGQQLQLDPIEDYLPLRLFGGSGLAVADGQPYYDFDDQWLPLVEQQRPRYSPQTQLDSNLEAPFDGREPDCVWHRLMLDGCLATDTSVHVWSRASNTVPGLRSAEWMREPDPIRRPDGPEQAFADKRTTTFELLFQHTRGRYLQLRLVLVGNGRATPALHALRAYYPRFSYRDHYLPSAYREHEQSASFVERFLANFEGTYTTIEERIAAAQILFDAHAAPPDVLDWLATWFGVALDPNWDAPRKRLFVTHAMQLFQARGTARGIEMALRLAMDDTPDESIFDEACVGVTGIRFVEDFRARSSTRVALGDPTGLPGQPGAAAINRRFREFQTDVPRAQQIRRFPLVAPKDEQLANYWSAFATQTFGFVPSANQSDEPAWRDFLARRYLNVAALNAAYALSGQDAWSTFADIPLPTTLPSTPAAIEDWRQFERIVVPTRRAAHRFTVLLPVADGAPAPPPQRAARLALAQRLIELEKPAHTVATVTPYWAIFRLGEVRLGQDTRLKSGSRAPELAPDMILAHAALAEAFLGTGYPYDQVDRDIVGREHLQQTSARAPQGGLR